MIYKTRGIVLKTVKYGETSIITTIYTEMFGIQTYLVNGIRQSSRGGSKAGLFQPAAILDLESYHNDLKNLQRIREFRWGHLYAHVLTDVVKHAVASFMIEMMQKILKQPEAHAELFQFLEDCLLHLDRATPSVVANLPLFFAVHLPGFFGFRFGDTFSDERSILDLKEGEFTTSRPTHPHYLDRPYSQITAELLRVMHPDELMHVRLNRDARRLLMEAYQDFYRLQIQDFGNLKTLSVLQEVLG